MGTKKISAMTVATTLDGTESLPIVQSGSNKKTVSDSFLQSSSYGKTLPPQYVESRHIVFTEYSNVLADWNVFHGTKSLDIVNYKDSPTFENVKLTGANADNGLYATKVLGAPINIANKHIAFYYYIPSGSTIQYVKIHFDSSALFDDWTDYYEQNAYIFNDGIGNYSGWHLFTAATGDLADWNKVGAPDWTNIKYIRIYAPTDSTVNSSVVIGSINIFTPPNAKGLIIIGMDGAYSGHKQAVAYANAKGIPVTLYISGPLVGGVGRLTLEQLQDMKRWNKCLIASYLYPFSMNWQTMSLATKILAVKANAIWLQQNGFGDGAKICSPAGVGVRSEDIQRQIMNSLIDMPTGFNQSESLMGNLWDVKSIYANITPGSITAPALAILLANVIAGQAVLDELWHSPYDNIDGTQAIWETHIDAIKTAIDAGTVEAVTPLDIWNMQIELNRPSFLVVPVGDLLNVTGDGTVYTVVFATKIFDINKDFDGASTFTAPMTGKYQFNIELRISGLVAGNGNVILSLITSNRSYISRMYPVAGNTIAEISLSINTLADMDVYDTAYVTVTVDGGAKVSDITAIYAYFSGFFVT